MKNPFAITIIILHIGAGMWSMAKADAISAAYYIAGAVLNIAVLLK